MRTAKGYQQTFYKGLFYTSSMTKARASMQHRARKEAVKEEAIHVTFFFVRAKSTALFDVLDVKSLPSFATCCSV